MVYTKGIDCSTWQDSNDIPGHIDWSKPGQYGVRFVINRAVMGATPDDDFPRNWQAQKAHGLLRGAYGFWDGRTGAPSTITQARALVNVLKPDPGEFPVVWMDFEKANSSYPSLPPRAQSLEIVRQYMQTVEDGLGRMCGLYCNLSTIKHVLSTWIDSRCVEPVPAWLASRPLWISWPLNPSTGETVEAFIARTGVTPNLYGQWKAFTLWQYSFTGPGKQMGMESAGLDMNYFNGSEADLLAFCGKETGEPEQPPGKDDPVTENPYKANALGYLAKSVTDPGWANTGFEFFVGYGCKLDGVEKPNDDLAPMERKAAELGKPFVISLDFTVKYYTGQQYGLDEAKWPAYNMDYPLQRFASIAANRQYREIWINFTDAMNHAGKPAGAPTLDFTLKIFLKKALEWAKDNRPDLKLRVFTNWGFMDKEVADGPQWLHNHDTGVKQPALTPLDESYPQKDDKPGWLGAQPGGPFWWYTDRLVMFDGDAAELRSALKFGGVVEPPPGGGDNPPPPPTGVYVTVTAFNEAMAAANARMAQMEAKHASDVAALAAKIPTGATITLTHG